MSRPPGWRTEILAGITTFFTMAYIVVVNPAILSTPGTGLPFSGALTATVLVCFVMTLAMGLYARLPFAVAPGMGINAFFTFSLVLGKQIPWQTALGLVFLSGVAQVLVSTTPLREAVARAIPSNLRVAAASGIGVFLTFIGLKNAGLVVADPVTFVKLGTLGGPAVAAIAGLALTVFLMHRKSAFAFLAGIGAVTAAAWLKGWIRPPDSLLSAPDFSLIGTLNVRDALKLSLVPALISMIFTDLFDSISTFIGVSQAGGLLDSRGQPKRLREGLIVDAFASLVSGPAGTSSATTYIESSAGIEMGGRTGLTAIATALCFLPCFFLAPLAGMVPAYATAPVLILVGALMFRSVRELELSRIEDAVPAFLAIVLIPLTFSITQGILWGFISHAGLYLLCGRGREVSPALYALALVSAALLWLEHA